MASGSLLRIQLSWAHSVRKSPPYAELNGSACDRKAGDVRVLLCCDVGPVPEKLEGTERDLNQASEVRRARKAHRVAKRIAAKHAVVPVLHRESQLDIQRAAREDPQQ